jgi:hypothetical protein
MSDSLLTTIFQPLKRLKQSWVTAFIIKTLYNNKPFGLQLRYCCVGTITGFEQAGYAMIGNG